MFKLRIIRDRVYWRLWICDTRIPCCCFIQETRACLDLNIGGGSGTNPWLKFLENHKWMVKHLCNILKWEKTGRKFWKSAVSQRLGQLCIALMGTMFSMEAVKGQQPTLQSSGAASWACLLHAHVNSWKARGHSSLGIWELRNCIALI